MNKPNSTSKSISIDNSELVTEYNKSDVLDMAIAQLEMCNKLLTKMQTFNNLVMKECNGNEKERVARMAVKSTYVFKQLTSRISQITKKIEYLYDNGDDMSVEDVQALIDSIDDYTVIG